MRKLLLGFYRAGGGALGCGVMAGEFAVFFYGGKHLCDGGQHVLRALAAIFTSVILQGAHLAGGYLCQQFSLALYSEQLGLELFAYLLLYFVADALECIADAAPTSSLLSNLLAADMMLLYLVRSFGW